jgi:DNA-binding protein H-NS
MEKQRMANQTLAEMIAARDELTRQIDELQAATRAEAVRTVAALIAEHDMTAHEVGLVRTRHIKPGRKGAPTFKQKAKRPPNPPKYRDPKTGATWTGNGKAPAWLNGQDRDEFLIY